MTKIRDFPNDSLLFEEGAEPATPASGTVRIYAKPGGGMYAKDDAGTETALGGGGGGSGDVVGPASSTDSHVALFDGVTGKLLKDGGALGTAAFDDAGDFATSAQGALAESAVQPGDLGTMAAEDDAPSDGSLYGRKDGDWEVVPGGGGSETVTIITEASAFTATPSAHAGKSRYIRAGGDVTFDDGEGYAAGQVFNIRATDEIELVEDGVTLIPTYGGTLELEAGMAVTVIMTSPTTADVIGLTVAA